MEGKTARKGQSLVQRYKRFKRWQKVVSTMACIVVFCTTYALILPALTLEGKTYCNKEEHVEHSAECYSVTEELVCGKEKSGGHNHSSSCYKMVDHLVCGMEESDGHKHGSYCYEESKNLTCGKEESEGHSHGNDCYDEDGNLICELAESEGHKHSDSCYTTERELICDKKESDGHMHGKKCYKAEKTLVCDKAESNGHKHDKSCYKQTKTLTCKKELHQHSKLCYSNPNADLENASVWEKSMKGVKLTGVWADDVLAVAESQLGYQESTNNYVLDANGKTLGYTRYGEWYGNKYGHWCAMFVSFCLNYAEVDEKLIPYEAGCQNWIDLLSKEKYDLYRDNEKYIPKPGDLIFFDWDSYTREEDRHSEHIGLVAELIYEKDGKKENLTKIKTIEGNANNMVKYMTYKIDDDRIMGYGELPENPNYVEETAESKPVKTEKKKAEETTAEASEEQITEAEVTESESETDDSVETESETEESETEAAVADQSETEEAVADETETDEPESEALDSDESETEAADPEDHVEDALRYSMEYEGSDYIVTVAYSDEAQIPDDAELIAEEYDKNSKIYKERYAEAAKLYGWSEEADYSEEFRLFNIGFYTRSGFLGLGKEEVEPQTEVQVTIVYKNIEKADDYQITHFGETPETIEADAVAEDGDAVISFQAESFSDYGVMALAADDGIMLLAANGWSDPPAIGNLTGKVVKEPIVGEWYILYGYSGSGNAYALPESWPNRGPSNQYGQNPCPTLSQASTQEGGTVKYTGTADMAWQYVGESGFVNRYGYYLRVQTDARRRSNGTVYAASINFTVSTNAPTLAGTNNVYPVYYNWGAKSLYANTKRSQHVSTLRITNQGYSDQADFNTTAGSYAHSSSSLNMYIAQVTGLDNTNIANGNHPPTTVTGTAELGKPVLYSMDGTTSTMVAVPNVEYTIRDQSGKEVMKVETRGTIDNVISGLPQGTYTIEQTAVPSGYVVTPQKRTITIGSNGNGYIGTFFVYKDTNYKSNKTGQVINYAERIYQVDLSGQSGKYQYTVDPLHIDLVVDVSNSMLFPAELVDTGKQVTLRLDGTNNATALNNQNLDKRKTYYFIADTNTTVNPAATSTVYALYWCGNAWVYQDASFYSKAYRHWEMGDENNVKNNVNSSAGMYRDGATVPSSPNYVNYVRAGDTYDYRDSRGGDITKSMSGATAIANSYRTTNGGATSATHTFKLYTATEYNRLHELQQAVATLGSLVQSFNPASTIRFETFAKEVYECNQYTMNNQGLMDLIDFTNRITTEGGTRQDKALKHLIGDGANTRGSTHEIAHLTKNNGQDDYVILITDGAPNTDNAATTIADIVQTATNIKNNYMEGNDRFITVGLSSENIAGNMLPDSASSPSSKYYKKVEESGQLTQYFLDLFYSEFMKYRTVVTSQADIVDVVSDSFYITDANGNALAAGSRIDLNGNPDRNGPGLICHEVQDKQVINPEYDEENHDDSVPKYITIQEDKWYVKWENQTLGTGATGQNTTRTVYTYTDNNGVSTEIDPNVVYYINYNNGVSISGSGNYDTSKDKLVFRNGSWIYHWRDVDGQTNRTGSVGNRVTSRQVTENVDASPEWHGKVYLKAKEDFIGGNVIDSNKEAGVYIRDGEHVAEKPLRPLPTPTLNVRLLPIEGFESEETVFLGDEVKDIREKIQTLLEKTVVNKIKSGLEDPLNKFGKGEDDGVYSDYFTIPYAIRKLTEEEWSKLLEGEPVSIDYTYDDDSSHGAVGYFTLSLQKEAADGEPSEYKDHESKVAGEEVEKYTLTVSYTSYKKNEPSQDGTKRPASNVNNGTNGPGTEVGGSSAGTTLETGKGTESVDEIHHVHVIDGEIFLTKVIDESLKSDQDQTFTFELYVKGSESEDSDADAYRTVTVTVPAGETQGTIQITDLPRNDYIVKESNSDDYAVTKVEVITGDTICDYKTMMPELEFEIGTNMNSNGINPDHNVIIFNQTQPNYEDSVWINGKRYVYSKPFTKPGTENSGSGSGDSDGDSTSPRPGYHLEDREVEVYAWESGTIISDDTSGTQYTKLSGTTESLDDSHTNYGVLTQSATNEDNWTVTWTNWTSEEKSTTTYDWPEGTLISTNTFGTQYQRLTNTQTYYDNNHTSYGILKKNSSGNWVIEWHTWTSTTDSQTTPGTTTYEPVTIGYRQNNVPNLSQYVNNGYYYKNDSNGYELITSISSDGYNLIITTASTSNKYVDVKQSWVDNANYLTYDIYKKVTTSGSTTQVTTWKDNISDPPVPAETSKLPTTSTTTTTWTKETSTATTADNTKIPKTTKTIKVEVEDEPEEPDPGTGTVVESVTITKLSAGHGVITNTEAKYEADIPVQKKWEVQSNHDGETVYVVLVNQDGAPVKDVDGFAKMLKLDHSNEFKGKFTVPIPNKDYNPITDGHYGIREVKEIREIEFNDATDGTTATKAMLPGDQETVYYVTLAAEGSIVTINENSYKVQYSTEDDTLLVAKNLSTYELPETGGMGTNLFTTGGLLLMSIGLLYGFSLRRKRERRYT